MQELRSPFYVTGGTVQPGASSYIRRDADEELYGALRRGEFCYVLTSRQMGKSSLMVRTALRLREEGAAVAAVDLTSLGQCLTQEQWYQGLVIGIARPLGLEDEAEEYWLARREAAPLQRCFEFLREHALPASRAGGTPRPLVLFLDEIDFVRSLPFPCDEFFAALRECYNRRGLDPAFGTLTFCLLGVATPGDLIRDPVLTPFNIGRRVELRDFSFPEALPLAAGLARRVDPGAGTPLPPPRAQGLLRRVLYWTGGHPYLTQRLCAAVAEALEAEPPEARRGAALGFAPPSRIVDCVCRELFLQSGAERRDDNLAFVRERLLRGADDVASLLETYRRVLRGQAADDPASANVSVLHLAGVVRAVRGKLRVRNRIYRSVFDEGWIRRSMPEAEKRRQRAAFLRGVLGAAAVGMGVTGLVAALALAMFRSERRAVEVLRRYRVALGETERAASRAQEAERKERLQRSAADAARVTAGRERGKAVARYHEAAAARLAAVQAQQAAEAARLVSRDRLVRQFVANGQRSSDTGDLGSALNWYLAALKADGPDPARAARHRSRIADALRRYPHPVTLYRTPGRVSVAAFSRDGRRTAISSPDFRQGVAHPYLQVLESESGRPAGPRIRLSELAAAVAISDDGRRVLSTGGRGPARLWDAATGRLVARLSQPEPVHTVGFAADGSPLTGGAGSPVRLWSAGSPPAAMTLSPQPFVASIAADARNQTIALARGNLLSVVTRADGREQYRQGFRRRCVAIAISPDGGRVATACDDLSVQVRDTAGREAFGAFTRHSAPARALAFSPDGRYLASGSDDRRVYVSYPDTGDPVCAPLWHEAPVVAVAFSRDGRRLLSATSQGVIRAWDLAPAGCLSELRVSGDDSGDLIVSRDGRLAVTRNAYGRARVWGTEGGFYLQRSLQQEAPLEGPVLSQDGRYLAGLDAARSPQVYETAGGRLLFALPEVVCGRAGVEFSPDGSLLAARCSDNRVRLWRLAGREHLTPRDPPIGEHTAISRDNRRMLAVFERRACVWDVGTMRAVHELALPATSTGAAISPDGQAAAVPLDGGTLLLWSADSGRVIARWPAHDGDIQYLTFSPDSRFLVTCGADRAARVWNARTGREVCPALPHARAVRHAAFSSDGRRLVTCGTDGSTRVWDAGTGEALGAPFPHPSPPRSARFVEADRRLLVELERGIARLLEVEPTGWPAPRLEQAALALTAHRLDARGLLAPAPPGAAVENWEQAARDWPGLRRLPAGQRLSWLQEAAAGAEQARDWPVAAGCLRELCALRPRDVFLQHRLGQSYGALGDLTRAEACFTRSAALGGSRTVWYHLALTRLALGIRGGYRQACAGALERFGRSVDPREPDLATWTCALGPLPAAHLRRAAADLQALIARQPANASLLSSLAALRYRQGRCAEALAWLGPLSDPAVVDHLFTAMTLHRLGRGEAARRALSRASEAIRQRRERPDPQLWDDTLEQRLLLVEARALLAEPSGSR